MIVSCNKLRGQHDDPVILRVWHVPYMMPCTRFLMPQDLERAGVFLPDGALLRSSIRMVLGDANAFRNWPASVKCCINIFL